MEEFELTYLPKSLPEKLFESPQKEMLDIYIPASSDHPHLRIRRAGTKLEITNKQPILEGDASHQLEQTIPLTPEEFEDLEKIPGKRVYKTRYFYSEDKIEYEVDVFGEDLKGLVLIDVEFASADEKNAFVAPQWLGEEVTQEKFIAGGMLSGKAYKDIQEKLEEFGYSKIESES